MEAKGAAYFGVAAIATLYIFIIAAVLLSPWFSWVDNALSDLGNLNNSPFAALFNAGLLISGFLTIVYSIAGLRGYATSTSWLLALSGLSLQLVGCLNEAYGDLHFIVSVLLFLLLLAASLSYFAEKRSLIALLAPLGIIPWAMLFAHSVFVGAALPEIISSLLVAPWIISSIAMVYKNGHGGRRHIRT